MRDLYWVGVGLSLVASVACSGTKSNSGDAAAGQGGMANTGGTANTGGMANIGGTANTGGVGAVTGGRLGIGGATNTGSGIAGGASTSTPATGGNSPGGASNATLGTGGKATGGASFGGASGAAASGGSATGGVGAGGAGGDTSTNCAPAVIRGGQYFTFAEKFNRYYTDCAWLPSSTVFVSPSGTGNGASRTTPASVATALAAAVTGRMIVFLSGTYSGCFELGASNSGTYDNPVVLFGERLSNGLPGVTINCCATGRKTCINLEAADYVAVDGFELVGGDYGVRSVGAGYPANQHQKGVAVLNNVGHGQNKDPFFTGQSDWFVIESCTGHDSGTGDGHGIYLSNGSDWNIARFNETYNTVSSDFQINADPNSTCADDGVPFTDPECDGLAGSSATAGRGASDYMLIDANFFHHSQAQGPNFTSVRNSTIKNNIFALPARHGASFWQETDNPKLGASNNLVAHNLFVVQASNRQAIGLTNSSTGNSFKNNVIVAVSISGSTVSANASGQLLATDTTTLQSNTFERNAWISGFFGSDDTAPAYAPNSTELRQTSLQASWFAAFPTTLGHDPAALAPAATAPWLDQGNLLSEVPVDRASTARKAPVDLGPYER